MKNIVLIGLPGAGKSTVGVILAKTLGMKFIDTDIVIQEHTGRLLQEIIDTDGPEFFLKKEEESILSLHPFNSVIATGGSAVYGREAMEHLKSQGIVVFLNISYDEMVKRLSNIKTRGIVRIPGQTLHDLFDQRIPLYEKYADIRIDCSDEMFEHVVEKVVDIIRKQGLENR
ncbi:shikimate kinase [Methanospirillum stamsii]|uniref:Shikimate kinase n=1 Tax=Methanospirillum stamsii TaxID=1277351 RepID=A0A2V2N749_9EURY|nr:shikimate kinase [Methanospirillum stamsii]PWR75882.1 shikimate kinase [Methanospirillum stamsii]